MARRTNYGVCKATGKRRFPNEGLAKEALRSARKAASKQKRVKYVGRRRTESRYYPCDDCKGWHLTSIREWRTP